MVDAHEGIASRHFVKLVCIRLGMRFGMRSDPCEVSNLRPVERQIDLQGQSVREGQAPPQRLHVVITNVTPHKVCIVWA